MAAQKGHMAVMRCMVMELGYDVNTSNRIGATPCFVAAQHGNLAVLKCLVKELGADINITAHGSVTPLMAASINKHAEIVQWMIKEGADTQTPAPIHSHDFVGTAADASKAVGASVEQTASLEAKTHCSNPGCNGAATERCPACKQARYCGEPCQYAHWKAHKADCKRWSAELQVGK
jgi:hypothetical protein